MHTKAKESAIVACLQSMKKERKDRGVQNGTKKNGVSDCEQSTEERAEKTRSANDKLKTKNERAWLLAKCFLIARFLGFRRDEIGIRVRVDICRFC